MKLSDFATYSWSTEPVTYAEVIADLLQRRSTLASVPSAKEFWDRYLDRVEEALAAMDLPPTRILREISPQGFGRSFDLKCSILPVQLGDPPEKADVPVEFLVSTFASFASPSGSRKGVELEFIFASAAHEALLMPELEEAYLTALSTTVTRAEILFGVQKGGDEKGTRKG